MEVEGPCIRHPLNRLSVGFAYEVGCHELWGMKSWEEVDAWVDKLVPQMKRDLREYVAEKRDKWLVGEVELKRREENLASLLAPENWSDHGRG